MLDLNISLSVSLSDPLLIKHFDHYNSNRPLHRSADTLSIISTAIAAEPEAPAIISTNSSFNHGLHKMLNNDNHNHSSDRSDCSEIEETIDLLQLSNSCLNVVSADIISSKKRTQRNIDSSSASSPIERSNISSSHGDAPDQAPHGSTTNTNPTLHTNHSNAAAVMSKLEAISADRKPSFPRHDHHHDLHGSVINSSSSSPSSAERSYNFQRRISRMQLDHMSRTLTSKKIDSSDIMMETEAASIRLDQAHNKKQMFEGMDMADTAEVICKEEDAEGEEGEGEGDGDGDDDSKHHGRTRQLFPLKPTGGNGDGAGDIDDGDNKIEDMVVEIEDEDREANNNTIPRRKPPSPNGRSTVNSLCRSNVHLSNPSSSSSSSLTNINTSANAAAMASVEANSAGLLSKCNMNGSSFSVAPSPSLSHTNNSSTIRPPPWFANSPLLPLPPASSSLSQAFMAAAAAAAASINTSSSSSSSSCTSSSSSVQYSVVQNNMAFPSLMIHQHNHNINKQNHPNPNQDNQEHLNLQNYQNQNQNHHEYVNAIANGTAVQVQQRSKKSRRGPRSRSSQYRGVTFYRRTGRWESHIWDTGKQVYLGGFDTAHAAARAYDRAAIKFRGLDADINFHINDYEDEIKHMSNVTKEEFVHLLRRQSMGFPRGSARFRGMALHKYGKWDARMGPLFGRTDETITNVAIPLAAPLTGREPMGPDDSKQDQNLELSLSMPARRHQQAGESRPISQSSLKLSNFPAEQEAVWRHNNQANFTGKFSGQLTSTTEMTQEQLQQVLLMQSRSASISRMHQVMDPSPLSNGMWAWQVQQLIAPSAAASSGFSPQQQIQQYHHHHQQQQQQQQQQNHHHQQQQCQEITKPQYPQKTGHTNTCLDKASHNNSKKDFPHQLGLLISSSSSSSPLDHNV